MKIRTEVKVNIELEPVFEFISNGENLKKWNSAVIKSDFKSGIDENTKIYSIIRKLPKQIIENSLEITVNKTVKTIHMRTISGPIPFTYHYKMVSFRGTTIVILNAEINKPIINVWKMKHIPRILLKNMLLKDINRNLYSLKIDLEKIYKIDETTGVI